jgi:hypothetical protein
MNASHADRSPSVDDVGPFADLPTQEPEEGHVRDTWLRFRVMATIDLDRGGGYRWDPSAYRPIPVEQDGEDGFAFAKVRD